MDRIVLLTLAVVLVGYGIACLANPELLAGAAGVAANSVTGRIELQVMYGGLQIAVGVLCLLGGIDLRFTRAALIAMLFVMAGLAVTRVSLGVLRGDTSAYTVGAAIFETCTTALLAWLTLRASPTLPE